MADSQQVREDSDPVRVLIVDDEEAVCHTIATMLGARGYDTATACTGADALALLREEYFDVMICDVRMPEMNGLETMSQALLIDNNLPVLILTGIHDLATARDALARGAMDYLTKPIEMDDLDRAVKGAAAHHRGEVKRKSGPQRATDDVPETMELKGGPLAGRVVRVEDPDFRMWVVIQPDGQHVWASVGEPDLPEGSRILGCYAFSEEDVEMRWVPKSS